MIYKWITNDYIYNFDEYKSKIAKEYISDNLVKITYNGEIDDELRYKINESMYTTYSLTFTVPINISQEKFPIYVNGIISILNILIPILVGKKFKYLNKIIFDDIITFFPIDDDNEPLYVPINHINNYKINDIQGYKMLTSDQRIWYVLEKEYPDHYNNAEYYMGLPKFIFDYDIKYDDIYMSLSKLENIVSVKFNNDIQKKLIKEISSLWGHSVIGEYQNNLVLKYMENFGTDFIQHSMTMIKNKTLPYLRIRHPSVNNMKINNYNRLKITYLALLCYISISKQNDILIEFLNSLYVSPNLIINVMLSSIDDYHRFIKELNEKINYKVTSFESENLKNSISIIQKIFSDNPKLSPLLIENYIFVNTDHYNFNYSINDMEILINDYYKYSFDEFLINLIENKEEITSGIFSYGPLKGLIEYKKRGFVIPSIEIPLELILYNDGEDRIVAYTVQDEIQINIIDMKYNNLKNNYKDEINYIIKNGEIISPWGSVYLNYYNKVSVEFSRST